MKKVITLILSLAMCLVFFACGNNSDTTNATNNATEDTTEISEEVALPESKLGNSIESDILRITLVNAQFAIKLNSTSSGTYEEIMAGKTKLSDKYFTAEEYDPAKDAGKAYIAAKGHTYVAIEFKAENLDRTSVSFDGAFNDRFMTIEYDGNTYKEETKYGCESENGYKWVKYNSSNILLLAGKVAYYRCYIDIPVDVADLNDDFNLIFALPNSKGGVDQFKYVITAADRTAIESQEISVDEAIHMFTKTEGQEYFQRHMNEYSALSGSDIQNLVQDRKWNIVIVKPGSSWSGGFRFDSDGRIQETIQLVGVGYFNNRTWSVNGDMLILDRENSCQVRKIKDGAYLLVKDNAPYAILN